ncbi:MAG: hypothetical protein KIT36_12670 [Alphaproteobacteria bacterium]|nr:hypothetical protein [Alphaproteobacteria bacterium]
MWVSARSSTARRLAHRWLVWLALAAPIAPPAAAQPSDAWTVCRQQPTRACVLAEAMARLRSDAPPAQDPKFADWERLLYLRLTEMAVAGKDSGLFDAARRSATLNTDAATRRSALRWVSAGEARAGMIDEALKTLADGEDDGDFAATEIALALARAGRKDEAAAMVSRLALPEARLHTLLRLGQATRDTHYLDLAAAMIRDIDDAYLQSKLRPDLAIAYAELGHLDEAHRAVRGIAVSYHRALALAGIAALTRDARLLSEARSYATGFDGRGQDDEVWAALARAEITLGVLDGARKTLEGQLPARPSRPLATAVGELSAAYWLEGEHQLAKTLIDTLLGGSWFIGEARAVLARRLIAAGRLDDARQESFLADEITFDNLSAEIALKQAAARDFRAALQTADKIQHPARRSPTLAEIAALLPE